MPRFMQLLACGRTTLLQLGEWSVPEEQPAALGLISPISHRWP